ncbi:MAG TPA: S9 family peptidase [Pyrinomonadaceae bacterium]|jgi:dipeptidyl aminopeptidase/acylaminoacyl peptidase
MRRLLLLLVLLLIAGTHALAQKRAFNLEDLYRIKNVSDVHVSPDGKSIVYMLTTSDLSRARRSSQIWIMDADGRAARAVSPDGQNVNSPRFSPDGSLLSFITTKDGNANIFLMNTQGGEVRQVTNISTGVYDQLWSPDGKWMAFSTDVYPECNGDDACNKRIAERWETGPLKAHMADDLFYRHWNAWKDGTRTHIYLVSVATGQARDLTPGDFDSPSFQLGGPLQYDFSPDGTEFVFVSNHDKNPETSTNNDLWLLSLTDTNAKPRNITTSNPAYDGSPMYSPDGRYIGYRMQKQPAYESDLFRLAVYDRKAGTSTVLTETFRNWVDEFEWAEDSKTIFFNGGVEGVNPLYRLEVASKKIEEIFQDKTIGDLNFSRDGQRLIYTMRSTGEPAEIYSQGLGGGKPSKRIQLSHFNETFMNEVDVRPAETMWVTASDGQRIQVFVVKPHGFDPTKKYPLILNVHGGPQQMWGDAFRGDWQVYPGAGYVAAFCNPRGSTGYGQEFTAEISGDMGGKVFDDLMKVTDSLERLPYVDSNRMGAMGWSYGGYMMMWFEGHTTRFKTLASMMGIYDWRSFYGATEELWWPEWDVKGQPWNNPAGFDKWSPSNYVKNFKTPALVISGERDYRVPYTQSLQFYTALRKMKVPARLVIYSNAGHWPSWYEMVLYYTAHLEWFHDYLGGQPPPWTTEAFLRNQVFDRATGKRFEDSETKPAARPGEAKPPQNPTGKPDTKPTTP